MGYDCASAIGSPASASDQPGFGTGGWRTDFDLHCVPLSEIVSGGPGRDGIPPIDEPHFTSAGEAAGWLDPREPVMVVVEADDARAYPLQILIWHEIVNDTVGGIPVAVSYCPLCNSAVAYDRRLDGRVLEFGTSGRLYQSALVMYDRQTESLWSHFTGQGVIGALTGEQLRVGPGLEVGDPQVRGRTAAIVPPRPGRGIAVPAVDPRRRPRRRCARVRRPDRRAIRRRRRLCRRVRRLAEVPRSSVPGSDERLLRGAALDPPVRAIARDRSESRRCRRRELRGRIGRRAGAART